MLHWFAGLLSPPQATRKSPSLRTAEIYLNKPTGLVTWHRTHCPPKLFLIFSLLSEGIVLCHTKSSLLLRKCYGSRTLFNYIPTDTGDPFPCLLCFSCPGKYKNLRSVSFHFYTLVWQRDVLNEWGGPEWEPLKLHGEEFCGIIAIIARLTLWIKPCNSSEA